MDGLSPTRELLFWQQGVYTRVVTGGHAVVTPVHVPLFIWYFSLSRYYGTAEGLKVRKGPLFCIALNVRKLNLRIAGLRPKIKFSEN